MYENVQNFPGIIITKKLLNYLNEADYIMK